MKLLDKNGNPITVPTDDEVGDGHEAIVYGIGDKTLAKIYRQPSDSLYQNNAMFRGAAQDRLAIHQTKLPGFPANLPPGAVGPISPLWNRKGWVWSRRNKVVGYLMPWIKDAHEIDHYMRPQSRAEGTSDETVVRTLIDFHGTLKALHQIGFVIGDLNDGNVLVKGSKAFAIDLDAGQYGDYMCDTFEPDYIDPLLIDYDLSHQKAVLAENQHYCESSDWYAFACMVLACLTYTKPYQGVFPGNVPDGRRPHERLSIFHQKVIFPKHSGARHWKGFLPEDLVAYLKRVFQNDLRGEFPINLLEDLLPGRSGRKPSPLRSAPTADWPTILESRQHDGHVFDLLLDVRGAIEPITRIQDGSLQYLRTTGGSYIRDNKHVVIKNETADEYEARGQHRFHVLHGPQTVTIEGQDATLHSPNADPETFLVDLFSEVPSFASNGSKLAWYENGLLKMADRRIAEGQTLWKSSYPINMVWMTQNGLLVSYHRSNDSVQLSLWNEGSTVSLSTNFDQKRPQELRVFADQTYLWVWTWHEQEVQIHCYKHSGEYVSLQKLMTAWAPNPEHVCLQQGAFLAIDAKNKLQQIHVKTQRRKLLVGLPFRNINQLLSHSNGGIALITLRNQIWQIA